MCLVQRLGTSENTRSYWEWACTFVVMDGQSWEWRVIEWCGCWRDVVSGNGNVIENRIVDYPAWCDPNAAVFVVAAGIENQTAVSEGMTTNRWNVFSKERMWRLDRSPDSYPGMVKSATDCRASSLRDLLTFSDGRGVVRWVTTERRRSWGAEFAYPKPWQGVVGCSSQNSRAAGVRKGRVSWQCSPSIAARLQG